VLIWFLLAAALLDPVRSWLRGEDTFDQAALREWLEEARNHDRTLSEMIDDYLRRTQEYAELRQRQDERIGEPGHRSGDFQPPELLKARDRVVVKREEIYQHLRSLGEPPTKMYPGQLPLFPTIFRMEVLFDADRFPSDQRDRLKKDGLRMDEPVVWDSGLPTGPEGESQTGQYVERTFRLNPNARVQVRYQLHAYNKRQRIEQEQSRRLRQLSLLALSATILGLSWVLFQQGREREQERKRLLAEQQINQAERLLIQEERRHGETEKQLLEQRLATQAAERQALELKSHLYASIGIMAGSYAHNIKNLLVRPNDLLRRCLEAEVLPHEQERMLREVRQTLGTVTERLQQILHTIRHDPNQSELQSLDMNALVSSLGKTWRDLAADRWKLDLVVELGEPRDGLWIAGDMSHLQQAVENLLFNARDATFEMRNYLRDIARTANELDDTARRQAVIEAAAWRGCVHLRTGFLKTGEVILEVSDNGAGMTEEVRKRCTQTHFSTKRDNALYEGHSTGMGLGLSFVVTILENHGARLEIDSEPLKGTTFRARFPAAAAKT
jgi:signal transduction histidine kinase